MAESFHTIIDRGTFIVNHQGEDREFNLPGWLSEAKGLTEDESALLLWAQENEILLPLMQSGLKELIIALRAVARPKDIAGELKGEKIKVIWDSEPVGVAQERLYDFIYTTTPRPGQSKTKAVTKAIEEERRKMAEAMRAAGVDESVIAATISNLK